jgi:hypothetical protein
MPGMTAMATHMLKKSIADLSVPDVPDFLDQIVAAGGHLWACRMSGGMNHRTVPLRDNLQDPQARSASATLARSTARI